MHIFIISNTNAGGTMVHRDPLLTSKRYPENWAIPSVELIDDPRPGKFGKTWIANVPGEKTPFVDEQSNQKILDDIREGKRKLPTIAFTNGRRKVEETNVCEYQYLKLTKFNIKNKTKGITRTFFEYVPAEISKDLVEKEMKVVDLTTKIAMLDENKLKAVTRVIGAIAKVSDFDVQSAKYKLIMSVKRVEGQRVLEEILADPMLEYRFDILDAIDSGVLTWSHQNPNILVWKAGGIVCTVPAGNKDRVQYAAQYLYNNGFDTLTTIRKMLGRVTVEETVEETNSVDITNWLKSASKEDILDKIFEWNKANPDFAFLKFKGPYLYFEEIKLTKDNTLKGREGAKEYLLESEKTFEDVFNIWKKYVL